MSIAELAAFVLAAVREEVIAECRAEGDKITLRFNDGTVRTITIGKSPQKKNDPKNERKKFLR